MERDLERVVEAARRVREAESNLGQARLELRAAVAVAHERGATISALARTLGLSRQRVRQLLGRA